MVGRTNGHPAAATDSGLDGGLSRASHWMRVSGQAPCPICKHGDWCSVTADGTLASCMRIAAGSFKTGADKNGAPFHLHRLNGSSRPSPAPDPRPPGPGVGRADADLLHRAYSSLLGRLILATAHREALRRRGLTDEEIDRRGYRTLAVEGRAALARGLRETLGEALLSVPGFVVKGGEGGRSYTTLAGAAGLLIPVRDPSGRVAALQSRRDDVGDRQARYSYLSSVKYGGPGPGTPAHVPMGTSAPCPVCRLTEGSLKADLAAALSGVPTVGAAGVSNWRPALDALQALGCNTVRLAFDADAWDKPTVARALAACSEAAAALGLAVELERWNKDDGKGIDDLLAAGKAPELLAGEAARAAIAEALASANAGRAPPPNVLNRLDLAALAKLRETDLPAYLARRQVLKAEGVSFKDLDGALAPYLRDLIRSRAPVQLAAAGYPVVDGCIYRRRDTNSGPVEEPLCNFTAYVLEAITRDDGAEQSGRLVVAGTLRGGRELPPIQVPVADFDGMGWITPGWNGEAIVYAGQGTRDHLRAAIQLCSPNRRRRTVYAHTGWREIGGKWGYLHAGGVIGPAGPDGVIEVELSGPLAGYALPAPPEGEALRTAVRASLALLDGLTADRIAFPLLAAVYRAALGEAPGAIDFSLWLAGPTQAGKSELAALAQRHFGAGMDRLNLPGNWISTANALEELSHHAKDALFVVDDYAPQRAATDRQRLEALVDRLLRGQGNRAGRQRQQRSGGGLRPAYFPRGLIVSTGEDVPPGQSLRGRMFVMEVSPDDVPKPLLTPHQLAAGAGLYAAALAGFVGWLAPQYGTLAGRLPGERASLRDRARAEAGSSRTPGVVADLTLGLKLLLDFALSVGAITPAEREALDRRGWEAIRAAAAAQADHIEAAEPTGLFLRLLESAIGTTAYVAGPDGCAPRDGPDAWGWHQETFGGQVLGRTEWRPCDGRRIGWVDGADLYLDPEASFAAAQDLAHRQGDGMPVSNQTLRKRLKERGQLVSFEKDKTTNRRTLEGRNRPVLHLRAAALGAQKQGEQGEQGEDPQNTGENPPVSSPCCKASPGKQGEETGGNHRENGGSPPVPPVPPVSGRVGGAAPGLVAPSPPPGARLIFKDNTGRPSTSGDCRLWTWDGADRWFDAREWLPPSP
jgi:Domain of unknown function (DUF3854)